MKKLSFPAIPAGRLAFSPDSTTSKTAGWLVCAGIAGVHAWTLAVAPYQPATAEWVFPLLIAVPGLVSMLLLPGEWKHGYRWLAILALAYASYAEFIPAIVFTGTLWALHRAWITERSTPLRQLFSLRRSRAGTDKAALKTA